MGVVDGSDVGFCFVGRVVLGWVWIDGEGL